jgi:hypothetical protein
MIINDGMHYVKWQWNKKKLKYILYKGIYLHVYVG